LPRLLPPARVAVLGPTYAEHAPAWRRAGHAVRELAALDEAEDNTEILVLVNPNNPDGRVVPRAELVWFAEKGVRLFVDEAFADLEPVESLVPVLPPRSVILRSFGKTYGLAGVRLGFAVAEPPFAQMVREALGPWAVSGPTLAVGGAALADEAWRTGAAVERRADARRLDALLVGAGCAVVGGTSLFRLVGHERAEALFMHLGRAGLFVRAFAEAPTRLRLGLPGDAQAWDRLAGALASFRP
jgi:cobalamin biosynthesis protein CobC